MQLKTQPCFFTVNNFSEMVHVCEFCVREARAIGAPALQAESHDDQKTGFII